MDGSSIKDLGLAVASLLLASLTSPGPGLASSASPSTASSHADECARVLEPVLHEAFEYSKESSLPAGSLASSWIGAAAAPESSARGGKDKPAAASGPAIPAGLLPLILDGSCPPGMPPSVGVDGGIALTFASSCKGDSSASGPIASRATSSAQVWEAAADASESWWQLVLAAPMLIDSVVVAWRAAGTQRSIPASYTLYACTHDRSAAVAAGQGGSSALAPLWNAISPAVVPDDCERHAMASSTHHIGTVITALRIVATEYAKNVPSTIPAGTTLKGRAHALESVSLLVPDTQGCSITPSCALFDLERAMAASVAHSSALPVVTHALSSLLQLSIASTSLQGLLRTAQVLLALQAGRGARLQLSSLPPALLPTIKSFMADLDTCVGAQLESALSFLHPAPSTGTSGVAAFDPDCKSGNINLSEDNSLASSSSSSKGCVYGSVGVSSGCAMWEFKVVQDSNSDECLCYGCGTKPRDNDAYDSGSNLYMIRGYNGYVYSAGSQSSASVVKIHKDDVVRFEADMDAGEVRLVVNDVDAGVVFRGLQGKEIFPAVCTYSGSRSVKFTRMTVSNAVATGGATPLTALPELSGAGRAAAPTSTGVYIGGGFLDEVDVPSGDVKSAPATIVVAGVPAREGISLRPAAPTVPSSVTFPLELKSDAGVERPFEFFIGRCAVDDSSLPSSATVSPVTLTLALDGRTVWSHDLKGPGESRYVRLPVAGAANLTLTARASDASSGVTTTVKTVWSDASVSRSRDWSFLRSGGGVAPPFLTPSGEDVSPLTLARFILSRVAFLCDAHSHVTSRGVMASAGIARIVGCEPTLTPTALLARARAYNAALPKTGKSPLERVTVDDMAAVAALTQLRLPAAMHVCAATFNQLAALCSDTLGHAIGEDAASRAGSGAVDEVVNPWHACARSCLTIIRAHLTRLVAAGVSLHTVGLPTASDSDTNPAGSAGVRSALHTHLFACGDASTHTRLHSGVRALTLPHASSLNSAPTGAHTLAPLHSVLSTLTATDAPAPYHPSICVAAADAIDAGLTLLYPTAAARTKLLTSLVSRGGTVEVHFKFPLLRRETAPAPAAGKDKDKKNARAARDPRVDRAILCLQLECVRAGWPHTCVGAWGGSVHFIVGIPEEASSFAAVWLERGLARVFARAGMGQWRVPAGCVNPHVPMRIMRVCDFDPVTRDAAVGDGAGIVRVYTRSAGSYDAVVAGVKACVSGAAGSGAAASATSKRRSLILRSGV